MIQNIGGFLTLAWLWSQRDKLVKVDVPVVDAPVEEVVTIGTLDDIPEHCKGLPPGSPSYISCVTGGVISPFNGNGNGEEPDIVGPLPVDPDEFDITTLPEYAIWDGIACAEHYTKVHVGKNYHVCKRDDLV